MTEPGAAEDVETRAWPEHLPGGRLPERVRDVVPRDVPSARSDFRADLTRALDVWREQPALPLMTTAYAALTALGAAGSVASNLGGIVAFVFLGWVGAERLWYLRAFTGRRLTVGHALKSALHYWGRFFVLGLFASLFILPLTLLALPAMMHADKGADGRAEIGLWVLVYFAVTTLIFDFALTFATPAIVYTTRNAKDALVIGLTLLRRSWPATVPYVLLPPLAVLLLTRVSDGPLGWVGAVIYVAASLVNLLAKGATAAYYLRVVPLAGPDGDTDHTAGWARDGWYR